MSIGAIYYTDCRLEDTTILKICREQIKKIWDGELISVSLNHPIDFGKNIVLKNRKRSYPTMALQILMGLEASTADYVYFLEHDVLYGSSHFDFTPPADDIYYYNVHNYRWLYPQDYLITYSGLTSLSSLCCNRVMAIKHYQLRLQLIEEQELDKVRGREPRWARRFGYEPGTKRKRNGGISDEPHVKRYSELPNIDIRHKYTFSSPKVTLDSFIHPPEDFRQVPMAEIPGWNLKELFSL